LRTQGTYAVKSSLIGRIAAERLVEQEKVNAQLCQESKEIKRNFAIAQSANLDLEKKVAELAETLKRCQDKRKVAGEDAENSPKELERLQKTHDEDLRMIENLRRDHDKSLKTIEDLRANNSDFAKSLSTKDRRVHDLEKALAEQKEGSENNVSDLLNKLKLLFVEYEKSLNEFGIRPAPPLPNSRFLASWNGSTLSLRRSPTLSLALAISQQLFRWKAFRNFCTTSTARTSQSFVKLSLSFPAP
jgi:hypothetical protein